MNSRLLFLIITVLNTFNSQAQQNKDWVSLFNGNNLKGWRVIDKPAKVQVKDRSMVLHMTANTARHAFVRTEKQYKDFIFEVEFRRDLTIDSGILFRSIDAPDTAFLALFGYMVKIDPKSQRKWTGGIFVDYGNGYEWLQTHENNEAGRNAENKAKEWNKIRIEAIHDIIKVWLNDVPTAHIKDSRYQKGYVGFKIHFLANDKAQEQLEIAYRNPKIITQKLSKYARPISLPLRDTRKMSDIQYFR